VEKAFFWLEIEVVKLGHFEDVMNGVSVVIKVGASGDSDVVHIDMDCCSEGFVLEDDVPVDIVHHGLERCWQISEPEIHNCGFEKSVSGFKCCFLLIPIMDSYIVIGPSDIKLCIYVCVAKVSNEVHN